MTIMVAGHTFDRLAWGARCLEPDECAGIRSLTDLVLGVPYAPNERGVAHKGVLWDAEIEEINKARETLMSGVQAAMTARDS